MSKIQPDQLKAAAINAGISVSEYERLARAIARCDCSAADFVSASKAMNKSGFSLDAEDRQA